MLNELTKLEQLLGYEFRDKALLERALTHRSWAHEHLPEGTDAAIRALQNESLEFVGDSVLGLAVAEHLYLSHPHASEGDLTLMKHHLVSTETLTKYAGVLGLGDFMRLGRGEEKTGGRKKAAMLADTFEAVIAAVFFDGGYSAARDLVGTLFAEQLKAATPRTSIDYKTLLQETLQAQKLTAPTYRVVRTDGPPHQRTFFVEATWAGGVVNGQGTSIKQAEMSAAREALRELNHPAVAAARQDG